MLQKVPKSSQPDSILVGTGRLDSRKKNTSKAAISKAFVLLLPN
jgi:hypothetical protein